MAVGEWTVCFAVTLGYIHATASSYRQNGNKNASDTHPCTSTQHTPAGSALVSTAVAASECWMDAASLDDGRAGGSCHNRTRHQKSKPAGTRPPRATEAVPAVARTLNPMLPVVTARALPNPRVTGVSRRVGLPEPLPQPVGMQADQRLATRVLHRREPDSDSQPPTTTCT